MHVRKCHLQSVQRWQLTQSITNHRRLESFSEMSCLTTHNPRRITGLVLLMSMWSHISPEYSSCASTGWYRAHGTHRNSSSTRYEWHFWNEGKEITIVIMGANGGWRCKIIWNMVVPATAELNNQLLSPHLLLSLPVYCILWEWLYFQTKIKYSITLGDNYVSEFALHFMFTQLWGVWCHGKSSQYLSRATTNDRDQTKQTRRVMD